MQNTHKMNENQRNFAHKMNERRLKQPKPLCFYQLTTNGEQCRYTILFCFIDVLLTCHKEKHTSLMCTAASAGEKFFSLRFR